MVLALFFFSEWYFVHFIVTNGCFHEEVCDLAMGLCWEKECNYVGWNCPLSGLWLGDLVKCSVHITMNKSLVSSLFSLKTVSLVVLSLQTTTMVLLLRYSRTNHSSKEVKKESSQLYIISTAVCMSEVFKFLASIVFLYMSHSKLTFIIWK